MYYFLLSLKGWSLYFFSGPKRSFWRRDSADCRQRGTKWSTECAEQVPSQMASGETLPPYLIFSIIWKNKFFCIIEVFRSRPMKMDIEFEYGRSKYTPLKKIKRKNFILNVFNHFSVTAIAWHSELSSIYPQFLGQQEFSRLMRYYPGVLWPV